MSDNQKTDIVTLYFCKRCTNEVLESIVNKDGNICPNCNYELTKYELECDAETGMYANTTVADIELSIIKGDEFDENYCSEWGLKNAQRLKNKNASNTTINIPTTPPIVTCPKCGSTHIQAVTRKWSLLTGFLTNKIDRVCLNCKTKF